jgi:SDR family mycofactocin-dependent oxidoreductase
MPAPEPQKPHQSPAPHQPQKPATPHEPHEPRVALVTGAARGIGAATVATLAQAGWRVLAVDRATDDPNLPYKLGTRTELEQVATDAGPNVITAQADVRDVEALARAVAAAEDRWGHLDAALAVAGVIAGGVPSWEMPAGQEQAVLDIDLGGVINLARVAVPALLRHPEPRQGRFLAVASAAATRGLPMLAAYCAAKSGVAGFIRALGAELRDSGVTANAVSPGSTATPILDESARLYRLPSKETFAAQQPLGRLLDPAEVAAVLAFLAGDGASAMTGAVIPVDGGLAL